MRTSVLTSIVTGMVDQHNDDDASVINKWSTAHSHETKKRLLLDKQRQLPAY